MRGRGRERASEEGGGRVFRTSPHPCAWPTWSLHFFLRNWAQQCRGVHEHSVPVRMRISVFWACCLWTSNCVCILFCHKVSRMYISSYKRWHFYPGDRVCSGYLKKTVSSLHVFLVKQTKELLGSVLPETLQEVSPEDWLPFYLMDSHCCPNRVK